MLPIFIAFVLVFSMAVNIKIISNLSYKIDNQLLNAIEVTSGFILSFIIVIIDNQFSVFKNITLRDCLYFGLSGFFSFGIAGYLSILHIRLSGEQKNSLLSPLITAIVVIGGYFVLLERVSLNQLFGILIVSTSVLFYEIKENAVKIAFPKAKEFILLFSLSLSVVIGIIFTRLQINKTNLSLFEILFLRYGGALIILFLIKGKKLNHLGLKNNQWIILLSVVISVIIISTAWVYCSQNISNILFQGIIATLPLFIIALNFFSEKKLPSLFFLSSCVLSLLGILILFS